MSMLDIIETETIRLGYRKEALRRNYIYSDVWSSFVATRAVPFAAFTQTPPSYRSAAFGVIDASIDTAENVVSEHRSLGAPVFLALESARVSVWQVFADRKPLLRETFAPEVIHEFFAIRKNSWSPDAIHRAKSISRVDQAYQLDFVDAGLIQAIEGEIHTKLDRLIRDALDGARKVTRNEPVRILFRGVFRLLAAKILMDRLHQQAATWDSKDVRSVLNAMDKFYSLGNVSQAWPKNAISVLDTVWKTFKSGFNVANISADDLAYIYESTLVTDVARAEFGTHSTPRHMADYIVGRLRLWEFGDTPPRVYEPFTGAGIFLCSALRYMRDALPSDWSDKERHDVLVNRIGGAEIDPFAAEVAKLSLILADYPNANGWKIEEADLFKKNELGVRLRGADVVLCNPPFESFKKKELLAYPDAALVDHSKAVYALEMALRAKPDMLGFVSPNTLLVDRRYKEQRIKIEKSYDEVEIVALPDRIFNVSQVNTVLLIARKHSGHQDRQLLRSSTVRDRDKKHFRATGKPSVVREIIRVPIDKPAGNLWVYPSQDLWESLATLPRLGSVLKGSWGLRWHAGQVGRTSDVAGPDRKLGFQTTASLHQFVLSGPGWMDVRADNILAGGNLAWDEPKLLCNATRLSRGYWRLAAAVDRGGRRASQQFIGLWPLADQRLDLDALAAVINSALINAFLSEHSFDKRFRIAVLEDAPIPHHLPAELGQLSRVFAASSSNPKADQQSLAEILARIDSLVFDAFGLDNVQRSQLRELFGSDERPLAGISFRRRRVPQALHPTESDLFDALIGEPRIAEGAEIAVPATDSMQASATEMLEIIDRVRDWAGGEAQAIAWYRSQPIPALDGRTAQALVESGRAGAVREYLDILTLGGFA